MNSRIVARCVSLLALGAAIALITRGGPAWLIASCWTLWGVSVSVQVARIVTCKRGGRP